MRWTMQVCAAGLRDRPRKDRVDRLRKALEAIDPGDQNILDAPVFQLVHDAQPEFGAFRGFDPKTENIRSYVSTATGALY